MYCRQCCAQLTTYWEPPHMVSSSSAALRVVVPEPGGLGEPLRVTHSLTGGAGPPRPPAGLFNSRGMSDMT